jgi:hypothetical protein
MSYFLLMEMAERLYAESSPDDIPFNAPFNATHRQTLPILFVNHTALMPP